MHNLESGWPKPLPAALCWDQSSDGVKPDLTCSSDGVKPDLTCSRTRKLFEPQLRRDQGATWRSVRSHRSHQVFGKYKIQSRSLRSLLEETNNKSQPPAGGKKENGLHGVHL